MALEQALLNFQDRASRVELLQDKHPHLRAEAATSLALVLPFIRDVLDYDVFDLEQVVPEYRTGIRARKVDFALLENGLPVTIIENKSKGGLDMPPNANGMPAYFNALDPVMLAIYTNGMTYHFYTDCARAGRSDPEPFLTLDFLTLDFGQQFHVQTDALEALVNTIKTTPNHDAVRACARKIRRG